MSWSIDTSLEQASASSYYKAQKKGREYEEGIERCGKDFRWVLATYLNQLRTALDGEGWWLKHLFDHGNNFLDQEINDDALLQVTQTHDCATLQEYKKAQQLTDHVTFKKILREPPKLRLRSRRPFVIEAARLVNLNQTDQETWEQSWIEGVLPGHDLMTNPTCPQPGFTLPRREFGTLNRLRCGHARRAEFL